MNKTQDSNILYTYRIIMPYALFDRDAFIARTGLGPDMNVLTIGPDYSMALQIARYVETTVTAVVANSKEARSLRTFTPDSNQLITEYAHQPIRDDVFDVVFVYNTINSLKAETVLKMFGEIRRILKDNSRFAILHWSSEPKNKAQSSHLMLLKILEQVGLVQLHTFDVVLEWLKKMEFEDITIELVNSQITVPEKWVQLHIKMLSEIIFKRLHNNISIPVDIEKNIELYKAHVTEYGEELLPSIQFTARNNKKLFGIDIL